MDISYWKSEKLGGVDQVSRATSLPVVFVLGAPRSGTTFVQQELARRRGVLTTPELHYIAHYLAPARRRWQAQSAQVAKLNRELGESGTISDRFIFLPTALNEEDFLVALRTPIALLVDRGRSEIADFSLLILKTPSDSLYVDDIVEVFPEARFIHVVRSPFDVICSYRAAHKTWAGRWAPRSTLVGAMLWRIHVLGASSAAGRVTTATVRFEDVRAAPTDVLDLALEALGYPTSSAFDEEHMWIVSDTSAQVLKDRKRVEPPDFGDGTKARPDLNPLQRRLITVFCRDLLATYDYLAPGERTELSGLARWTLLRVERWYNARLRRGITNALAAPSATVTLLPPAAPTN